MKSVLRIFNLLILTCHLDILIVLDAIIFHSFISPTFHEQYIFLILNNQTEIDLRH